jgi:hypothetical protein
MLVGLLAALAPARSLGIIRGEDSEESADDRHARQDSRHVTAAYPCREQTGKRIKLPGIH